MKNALTKYAVIAFAALATSFTSCGDWLDINTNPNASTTVDPDYIFNYAAVSNSGTRQGGDSYIPLAIGSQLIADGGFTDQGGWWGEAEYSFSVYSYGNAWVGGYANVLENLYLAVKYATDNEDMNTVAQCEILMALSFYQLTMLFGDIPVSQALDPESYPTPEFESQKAALEHCLSLLDHAISVATPDGKGAITGYDIYFKGDMTKWIKAAKAFKLQILLTLYNKEAGRATDIASVVSAGGFPASGADDWKFPYFKSAGTENPNWRLNDRYAADNIEDPASQGDSYYMFFAHNSVLNPMKQFDDPRMPVYFSANVDGGYEGLDTGEDAALKDGGEGFMYLSSPVNLKRFFTSEMADVLLSYQEVQFNLAEVYVKGIGVTKDMAKAQEALKNGAKASCVFWGVTEADATSFAGRVSEGFSALDETSAMTVINNQRWIDFMSRPFEAFCNQRRTKMPELTTPETAAAFSPYLFSRFEYPSREYGPNAANVPDPMPKFYEPLWFQK